MKPLQNYSLLLGFVCFGVLSCTNNTNRTFPTAQSFSNLQTAALNSVTQTFTMTAENGLATFTSINGVLIKINGVGLRKNGNPVTGLVDIKYSELFNAGKMVTADKATVGMYPNGTMALIISGGEFFIEATQDGVPLTTVNPIQLEIPTSLTGGTNTAMTLWTGQETTASTTMLGWYPTSPAAGIYGVNINGGPGQNIAYYNATLPGFGWSNVDCFYSDARPKTQIFATVPAGYNGMNSAMYLHYNGQGSSLLKFDTFSVANQQFSVDSEQVPIGLDCNIIFVTEGNGQWRYAIKPVTISSAGIYNFSLGETILGNQAQLEAAINALP